MRQNRPKETKPRNRVGPAKTVEIRPNEAFRPIERIAANMPIEDYTANIRPDGTIRHNWWMRRTLPKSVEFDPFQPIEPQIVGYLDTGDKGWQPDIWEIQDEYDVGAVLRSIQTDGAGWFNRDQIDQHIQNGTFLPITWDWDN